MGVAAHVGLLVACLLQASGCAPKGEPRAALGLIETPRVASGVGDLMTVRDRTRLEAIAAERAGSPTANDYRIGPDDLLEVRIPDLLDAQPVGPSARLAEGSAGIPAVAAAPVFQQGLRVTGRGEVRIPVLGVVRAEGLTAAALEKEIARRLVGGGILLTPQVSVQIAEYRSRVVAVVGSVERPGLYPTTRPRATLADLIWAAGGPSKDAGRVVEFAPVLSHPSHAGGSVSGAPLRLDLESLLEATGPGARVPNPEVRPGDAIKVSTAGNVLVDGWVEKPGSYPVTRGLTLSGAVAAAGGHLFAADRRRATVKRVGAPGEQRSFTVDLDLVAEGREADVPITDGDVVHVPAATSKVVPWALWAIAREMVHVGGNVLLF